eukprot:2179658-Alexandrium_andersonii.AAC.1
MAVGHSNDRRAIRSKSMRNRLWHSTLELRGPRNDLRIDPRSSGGERSAPLFALMPNLVTDGAGGRTGGASRG